MTMATRRLTGRHSEGVRIAGVPAHVKLNGRVDATCATADDPAGIGEIGPMKRNGATWTAFLAMTFCIVGLVGLFATYAAPLPWERMQARDAALDAALAAGDSKPGLEALRDRLDDSAPVVIDGGGPLAERVAAARTAMRAELMHEADAIGFRLRLELLVVTVVAAGFGAAILGAASRAP